MQLNNLKQIIQIVAQNGLSANFRQRINSNKIVHVKRALVGRGKILVNINEEVLPHDILGKSTLTAGFSVINLAKKLGVPAEEGLKYLQRGLGKTIFRGELLAFKKGLLNKKFITAPTDGIIENYDAKTGELRLEFLPKEIPLTSGVTGIVDDIDSQAGEVLLKTLVTEIYGVFGSGKERDGILNVLGNKGDLLNAAKITPDLKQHIIVAGGLIYGEALRKAAGYGVYGIISGGLNASDYRSIINSIDPRSRVGSDVGMSLFATEGFGPLPIGDDIYELLKSYHNKFVLIHGNTTRLILPTGNPDSILTLRKTALPIIKAPAIAPELTMAQVKTGQKVRLIWPPFMGSVGKIIGIDQTVTTLESSVTTYLLTVETPSRKIKVPYTNIEIIK